MGIKKLALFGCLVAMLSACSTFEPKSDEDQVKARAQARMDALLAKDMDKAYGFMTPGYRDANNVLQFSGTFGGGANLLVSADARRVTCEENVCKVVIFAQYRFSGPLTASKQSGSYERVNEEKWIRVGGKWWFKSLS